ncbi:hypothetical protein SADUNF_Sadunf06G0104400 [Salix dunnii]|uniref:Uncharacterized protein n=1 Tax=Salix dunnii TaxID=1413687 RepID=A0A835K6K0_9ROSI|nr:hypothetical protein SADUNF_Sadunf06G0104400 [Salix dunnii]
MGDERKKIFVGLMVAMILGFAVYFRLWTIDYAISSDDTELIRRQFDLANREASDESAEWRMKYDEEVERAAKCDKQLVENNSEENVPSRIPLSLDIIDISAGKWGGFDISIFCVEMSLNKLLIKQKVEDAATINQQMVMLQKENMALVGRMEVLKSKLEATKLKCRSKLDR